MVKLKQIAEDQASEVNPKGEAERSILEKRAALLAQEEVFEKGTGSLLVYTEFVIACEHYGIENRFIKEIRPLKTFTQLPCVPTYILGIINSRGRIVSVVDLKKYFSLPNKGIADLSKVIILKDENMEFGILADNIIGVGQCNTDALADSLPLMNGLGTVYLKGITPDRVGIIDGKFLLNDQNLIVNDSI